MVANHLPGLNEGVLALKSRKRYSVKALDECSSILYKPCPRAGCVDKNLEYFPRPHPELFIM